MPSNYKVYSTEFVKYDEDEWLNKSIKDNKKKIHDDAIGFIRQRIAKLKGIQLCDANISDDALENEADKIETKLHIRYDIGDHNINNFTLDDKNETEIKPDVFYEDDNTLILGEAKGTNSDLNKKDEKNKEQLHFISQILNMIKWIDENIKQGKQDAYILIGIPFILSSNARKLIYNSEIRRDILDDDFNPLKNGAEWFDTGNDDKFMHYITKNGNLIKIGFCYEITDKIIPAPYGYFSVNNHSEMMNDHLTSITCNAKTYPVIDKWIDTNDDKLRFDSENTRFYNIKTDGNPISYSQEESFARLISELDNDDKQNNHIQMTRKNAFINDMTINEPLLCYKDANDNIIVIDGNSRLANAREILKHAEKAAGYEYIHVNILQNVSRKEAEQMKDSAQHQPIVQHSKIHTALKLYENSFKNWPQALQDFTPGDYGISSIDVFAKSFYTIKTIKDYINNNNINTKNKNMDYFANKHYYAVYTIVSEFYDANSPAYNTNGNGIILLKDDFKNTSAYDFMDTIFNAPYDAVKNVAQIVKPIITGIKSSAKDNKKQTTLASEFMNGNYNNFSVDEIKQKIAEAYSDDEFNNKHVNKELSSIDDKLQSILNRMRNISHKPNKKQINELTEKLNKINNNVNKMIGKLGILEDNLENN